METSDEILLTDNATLSYVSDKYIGIYEPRLGDVFVFNRNGKIYSHFNHKGPSGQEYSYIAAGVLFNEENGEILVYGQSIQIYSLKGEYKRTLKINMIEHQSKVYNFNDDALLIYDDVIVEPGREDRTKKSPYRFMSKKDGSLISVLDIHFSKRYSTRMAQTNGDSWRPISLFYPHNIHYGKDFVIADISSDSLYLLSQDQRLTPLLSRKPSVHASGPRTVWSTLLTTDKFILMGLVSLDFNSKGGRIPILMYEFETGEICEIDILDYNRRSWNMFSTPAIEKNMTAGLIQASSIIDTYKKKQLKENIEEFVHELDEDDNPIVRIITFK